MGSCRLDPRTPADNTVTPVYEGWYANPDGTLNLSWGYFNRNIEETVEVPLGPANQMTAGGPDLGQPTTFLPGRHRGVFAVTVPADFGDNEITWTLDFRGVSVSIPPARLENFQPAHAHAWQGDDDGSDLPRR